MIPFGKKKCSACGELVNGRRTIICPHCKAEMVKPKAVLPILTEDGEPVLAGERIVFSFPDGYNIPDTNIPHISTPSGKSPIHLTPEDGETVPSDDAMREWAGNVRQHMINNGQYLSNQALIYWARRELNEKMQFAPLGDEMKYVGLIIGSMPDITRRKIEA